MEFFLCIIKNEKCDYIGSFFCSSSPTIRHKKWFLCIHIYTARRMNEKYTVNLDWDKFKNCQCEWTVIFLPEKFCWMRIFLLSVYCAKKDEADNVFFVAVVYYDVMLIYHWWKNTEIEEILWCALIYVVLLLLMMILMLYCHFSSLFFSFVHVKLIWFLCLNLCCRSMLCHLHNISLISAIKTLIDGWMNMSESAGDE